MEKAKEFQKNIYFCFIDYVKAFDCVDHNELRKIHGHTRPPYLPPEKLVYRSKKKKKTFRNGHGTTDWFKSGKGA